MQRDMQGAAIRRLWPKHPGVPEARNFRCEAGIQSSKRLKPSTFANPHPTPQSLHFGPCLSSIIHLLHEKLKNQTTVPYNGACVRGCVSLRDCGGSLNPTANPEQETSTPNPEAPALNGCLLWILVNVFQAPICHVQYWWDHQ